MSTDCANPLLIWGLGIALVVCLVAIAILIYTNIQNQRAYSASSRTQANPNSAAPFSPHLSGGIQIQSTFQPEHRNTGSTVNDQARRAESERANAAKDAQKQPKSGSGQPSGAERQPHLNPQKDEGSAVAKTPVASPVVGAAGPPQKFPDVPPRRHNKAVSSKPRPRVVYLGRDDMQGNWGSGAIVQVGAPQALFVATQLGQSRRFEFQLVGDEVVRRRIVERPSDFNSKVMTIRAIPGGNLIEIEEDGELEEVGENQFRMLKPLRIVIT